MAQISNQHPHAINISGRNILQKDGTVEYEVVITTDLALDVLHPKHDKKKVDDLLDWAHGLLRKTQIATRVIVTEKQVS